MEVEPRRLVRNKRRECVKCPEVLESKGEVFLCAMWQKSRRRYNGEEYSVQKLCVKNRCCWNKKGFKFRRYEETFVVVCVEMGIANLPVARYCVNYCL